MADLPHVCIGCGRAPSLRRRRMRFPPRAPVAGLHLMDRVAGTFERMPFDPAHPSRLGSPVLRRTKSILPENYEISFISEDQNERLWMGASEGGLNVYDPISNSTRHYEAAFGMTDSLQTLTVWHFCQTRDGVIWLGCGNGGWEVYRVKSNRNLFPFFDARSLGMGEADFYRHVRRSRWVFVGANDRRFYWNIAF